MTGNNLSEREKYLKKRFKKRWKNIEEKTEKVDRLELPNREKLWEKVLNRFNNGFECPYCGRDLKIKDPNYPHSHSFSIDHKVSVDLGGDNSIDNLEIICHRCNIIKGTMTSDSFKKMLETEDALKDENELLDGIFREMWDGRIKSKLNREEART